MCPKPYLTYIMSTSPKANFGLGTMGTTKLMLLHGMNCCWNLCLDAVMSWVMLVNFFLDENISKLLTKWVQVLPPHTYPLEWTICNYYWTRTIKLYLIFGPCTLLSAFKNTLFIVCSINEPANLIWIIDIFFSINTAIVYVPQKGKHWYESKRTSEEKSNNC